MHVPDIVEETDAGDRFHEMTATGRQRGRITLVRKDGRRIEARYEAYETRVARLPYYLSVLSHQNPLKRPARRPIDRLVAGILARIDRFRDAKADVRNASRCRDATTSLG